jgi:hypothetical protein
LLSQQEAPENWQKIKQVFQSSCANTSDTAFISKIYTELYMPLVSLPSKNYPFESNMMDHLPAKPLEKSCAFFSNITENATLAQQNENINSTELDSRQIQLFGALNKVLNLYTNYTGSKSCAQGKRMSH